jgi:L-serine dehydratase
MGTVGRAMTDSGTPRILTDKLADKTLVYTLAAQVGNHSLGLQPCAGTGDSCPYTGLVRAMQEEIKDRNIIARTAALVLKIGTFFRVAKLTTGCNTEGFGAGSAALAAAFTELGGGTPKQVENAVVIALSPTIAVPCTPRVMVAGLCATHIGGAVMIGKLASHLVLHTDLPVTVPADVMMVMAAEVHPVSATAVVPIVVRYMEPFFKTNDSVEYFITQEVKKNEEEEINVTLKEAAIKAHNIATKANSVTSPFGMVVVGGSSQAVGSPTNTARIAHYLSKGEITRVKVELYPELFARRGINMPGIMMAALYGSGTDDGPNYAKSMQDAIDRNIKVEILKSTVPQLQRITIYATEQNSVVDARNRGGGRLVLIDAHPCKKEAVSIAKRLGIVLVD